LYFSLCLLPLVLSLDTSDKSLALCSLLSPFKYLYTLIGSHDAALPPADQSQLFQTILVCKIFQFQSSSWPFTGHSPVCPHVSCTGLDTAFQMCLTCAQQRGSITSLSLLAALFLMQPRMLLAVFAPKAHCWLTFSWVLTRIHRSFSGSYFLDGWPPVGVAAQGFSSTGTGLGISLLEFHEVALC